MPDSVRTTCLGDQQRLHREELSQKERRHRTFGKMQEVQQSWHMRVARKSVECGKSAGRWARVTVTSGRACLPSCAPDSTSRCIKNHRRALQRVVIWPRLLSRNICLAMVPRTGWCSFLFAPCGFVSISCCCERYPTSGNSFPFGSFPSIPRTNLIVTLQRYQHELGGILSSEIWVRDL